MHIKPLLGQSQLSFHGIVLVSFLTTIWAATAGFDAHLWGWAVAMYFVYGCLGITVTYHRYLAHQSFAMHPVVARLFAFFGHLAGTGSAIAWVAIHHAHHKHADTELDPHSPVRGVLNMLAFNYKMTGVSRSRTVLRMARDPFYRTLHDYYLLFHILWSVGLYLLFGVVGVVFFHLVPVAITALVSGLSNYFSHKVGHARYETGEQSKNDPIMAFLSWGEGWHNNHHRFPGRAKFGEKWWELDVSWLVIRLVRTRQ